MKHKIDIQGMRNNAGEGTVIIAKKDGYFQLFMPDGTLIPYNIGISLKDNVNEPLEVTATFNCRLGKIISEK